MNVAIVGRGNVGTHLAQAIRGGKDKELKVSLFPSSLEGLEDFNPDLVILAVRDGDLPFTSEKLAWMEGVTVAHTAGSVAMDVLEHQQKRGVFYPLQTFNKEVSLDYSRIPVFIEGADAEVREMLRRVANSFTDTVKEADSGVRQKLHLAAVFACNFVNAMWGLSADILQGSGLDFEILRPLIEQTLSKTKGVHPASVQTGPAVRRDNVTIATHLRALEKDNPELVHLYKTITDNIIQNS